MLSIGIVGIYLSRVFNEVKGRPNTIIKQIYENSQSNLWREFIFFYEMEKILLNEVGPVLAFNLYDIAGEWAGFDENWLVDKIQKRLNEKMIK